MATHVKAKPRRNYRLKDGTKVPGVTTVLGNIGWKTPALTIWGFRVGQDNPDLSSPYQVTDEAADIGTVVHRAVELIMHGLPDAEAEAHIRDALTEDRQEKANNALLAFYRWRDGVSLEVTDTEVALVSEQLKVGGTIDYVALINGVRAIVDLKTSGGIYPDMWVQVGVYGHIWEEHHPDDLVAGGYYILRLDKGDTGGFDYSYRFALPAAVPAFKAARVLHDLKKELK